MIVAARDVKTLSLSPEGAQRVAEVVGLRYVCDEMPGFSRRRCGRGFTYQDTNGQTIPEGPVRERIEALVIPPAWEQVWICPLANGHLQATGRDEAGRKQYRYHAKWQEVRSQVKYAHTLAFAEILPRLRRRVDRDMRGTGMSRDRVLATVVRLLDMTLMRIGNDEYAEANDSYGLTTLRHRHVEVASQVVRFDYQGKSGQQREIEVVDPALAKMVRKCHELPGQELFTYVDENDELVDVESGHVNEYLRDVTGDHVTAKDFRTWGGTVTAAVALTRLGQAPNKTQTKKRVV